MKMVYQVEQLFAITAADPLSPFSEKSGNELRPASPLFLPRVPYSSLFLVLLFVEI